MSKQLNHIEINGRKAIAEIDLLRLYFDTVAKGVPKPNMQALVARWVKELGYSEVKELGPPAVPIGKRGKYYFLEGREKSHADGEHYLQKKRGKHQARVINTFDRTVQNKEVKTQIDPALVLIPEDSSIPKFRSTAGTSFNDKVIHIRLFTPRSSWEWYLAEFSKPNGIAFGFAGEGIDAPFSEWGNISIKELAEMNRAWLNGESPYWIERDLYFQPMTFAQVKMRY